MLRKATKSFVQKLHQLKEVPPGYEIDSILTMKKQYVPGVLFRAHQDEPEQVYSQNGFQGKGLYPSLVEHVSHSYGSAYVATSPFKQYALGFATKGFGKASERWLYTIENGVIFCPVPTSVTRELLAKQGIYGALGDKVMLSAAIEGECAVFNGVPMESIREARSIEGYNVMFITQEEALKNPNFMNMYFNIVIPSADHEEKAFIEMQDRKHNELSQNEEYLSAELATTLQSALRETRKEFDATHFSSTADKRTYELNRVKRGVSENTRLVNTIDEYRGFLIQGGARNKSLFFQANLSAVSGQIKEAKESEIKKLPRC